MMMSYQRLNGISRRTFLQMTGGGMLAGLLSRMGALPAFAETSRRVYLHTYDPAETVAADAVQAAMLAATDLSWLKTGDSVFVKVASNSNLPPPSVTSPAVLEGVVRTLKEAGAGTVYVGDMSGALFVRHLADQTIGSTRENMRTNGLLQAAEAAGATIHCFEEVPFEEAYIPGIPPDGHHWGEDLQVAEILDRVDHVVNLPRLGKHVLAGASLGMKNAIGWVSDTSRMVLHRDAATFQEKIAEVNAIPQLKDKMRLTLTLVDQILTTYGPDSGYHYAVEKPMVLASEDVVSHDQIALMLLLWGRQHTPRATLNEDPYPAQSHGFNWYFVRTTWDRGDAEQLATFDDLSAPDIPTQFNYAYDFIHGGRPDVIEVLTGGAALADDLAVMLSDRADLHIALHNEM
jgi:uncharacterized protein (DUF362 family)